MAGADYTAIKELVAEELLRIPGVHAVGVGGKVTDGRPTGELAVTVFVEHKRPLDEVPPSERIPQEVHGVKTDVVEMAIPTIHRPPGHVPGTGTEDADLYRPVRGGCQIAPESRSGTGTLGCLFTLRGTNIVVAVTNHHVIYDEDCTATANHEQAGQPTGTASSSASSDDIIGTVLDALCTARLDVALVRLKPGTRWLAEVEGVGPITGSYTVTQADAQPHTFAVKKRGSVTRLTGGTVHHVDVTGTAQKHDRTVHRTYTNGIFIEPDPDPSHPGSTTEFGGDGDSGSAVLDAANRVVGIYFGGSDATPTSNGVGMAFPVADLVFDFANIPGARSIQLEVATATQAGDVRTVAAMTADDPYAPPPTPVEVAGRRLEADLHGTRFLDVFDRHRVEVAALVHHNRRVTLVWHRAGGAELFQRLTRAFVAPGERVPQRIQGRPPADCLADVAAALRRFGSRALVDDLDALLPVLPDVAGRDEGEIRSALKRIAEERLPGAVATV